MATEYFNDAWRIPNNKNQSLVSNYSMKFNGTSDFVDCGNDSSLQITGAMTVSYWFKGLSATASATGVGKLGNNGTRGFALTRTNGNAIYFFIAPTASSLVSATATPTLSNTQWYHLVGVYTPSTSMVIYLDGVPIQTLTTGVPASQYNGSNNLQIGARGDSTAFFNGEIDQVCIFDYALPATGTNSVATLYGGGTAVTNPMALSTKPIAAYQLGDQSVDNGANYLVPNNSLQDYVFDFDGTDNYIDLSVVSSSSVPSEESSWTYSAWLYLDSTHTESFPTIFQRGQGYPGSGMLVRESAGNIQVFVGTALSNFTINKLPTNAWSHFALVYDLSTNQLTCYINNLSQTLTMVAEWSILTTTFNIGFRDNDTGYWKGEMSNVQVFNTALPSTGSNSIQTIYNNGSPLTSMSGFTSLQSWYKLNAADTFDGSNWTIKDYIGSNDGTSNGMTSANLVQSNLQHTSGYSPYSLSLDASIANQLALNNAGNGTLNGATSFTVSAWINPTSDTGTFQNIFANWAGNIMIRFSSTESIQTFYSGLSISSLITSSGSITFGEWQHIVVAYSGSEIKIYRNNVLLNSALVTGTLANAAGSDVIGNRPSTTQYFNGKMSNVAIWKNSVIDVNTLYNQGVPGDLTSLSPTGWWQLGSNSSFNSGVWTCLNQGTGSTSAVPANATSTATMTEDDITNGPGYSASGLGTSSIEIVGDAPYSTANGISENMDVLDRTTDTPG